MTKETSNGSQKPSHIAYFVEEGKDKNHWTRIGAAWPNKDGKGFNIDLKLIPVGSGRISLRVYEPKTDDADDEIQY